MKVIIVNKEYNEENVPTAVVLNFVSDFLIKHFEITENLERSDEELIEEAENSQEFQNYKDQVLPQWQSVAVLTRRKFMLGIKFYPHGDGTLEDAINTLRASLPEPQKTVIGVSLESSNFFERADQDLIDMATAIGMNADQIDEFYKWAENEKWRN